MNTINTALSAVNRTVTSTVSLLKNSYLNHISPAIGKFTASVKNFFSAREPQNLFDRMVNDIDSGKLTFKPLSETEQTEFLKKFPHLDFKPVAPTEQQKESLQMLIRSDAFKPIPMTAEQRESIQASLAKQGF